MMLTTLLPKGRGSSDRAEVQIFREVLDAPKSTGRELCNQLEILLPAADLTPGRSLRSFQQSGHISAPSGEVRRDTRLTQRVGLREFRLTLAVCIPSFIGIAICSQFKGSPVAEVAENVLIIFCWVTIWQPFQSLVFDRWTQSKTARVYERIAGMDIRVRAA